MCNMGSGTKDRWLPLEETHKGKRHKLSQLVQEQQEEGVTCYV